MNVYDFDGTIYDGESTFDYFLFCLKRHPGLFKFLHMFCINIIKYKLCLISKQKMLYLAEKYLFDLFKACPDYNYLAEKFWEKNIKKIKKFYFELHREDDVILSASFAFLLKPVCEKLGIKHIICSDADPENNKILALCFRENKPLMFDRAFPDAHIENFYTDSKNDLPFILRADNSYFVKGEKIIKANKSKLQK